MKNLEKIRWLILSISVLLFVVSLTQIAYCVDGKCEGNGFLALATGWLGTIGYGGAAMAWLANPFLFFSWIVSSKNSLIKIVPCALALLFGLSFLFFDEIVKDEAGHYGAITGYGLGYWLWMGSMGFYFIGTILLKIKTQQSIGTSRSL